METVRLVVLDTELAFRHKNWLLEKVSNQQKEKALNYKNEIDQMNHYFLMTRVSHFLQTAHTLMSPILVST